MHCKHDLCFDHDPSRTQEKREILFASLGHGSGFNLRASREDDEVHGYLQVTFCDTRTLGVDTLQFQDGSFEIATAENIARYFIEQGHHLEKIVGNKAYGNTIVDVEIYETDDPPDSPQARRTGRKSTLKRPAVMPTEESIIEKICNVMGRDIEEV